MPPFNLLYNLFLPSFLYSFAVSKEIPMNSATSEILYPFNVNNMTFPHCGGNCFTVVKIRANTSSALKTPLASPPLPTFSFHTVF